jgi:CxxC-x17-CxxC domain-containing protein
VGAGFLPSKGIRERAQQRCPTAAPPVNRRRNSTRVIRPGDVPCVCAACGKDTMVPFKPSTDKPVYCSDCFRARR